MKKIALDIIGISYSQTQSGAYALILGEAKGKRRLPIIIGGFEAQAIAIELERMKPTRPLTHDLFKNFAETFDIQMKEVVIYKFSEGVFYAKLICVDGKKEKEIDARTSDAVALAIRFYCPIYTYEAVLTAAGIVLDDESSEEKKENQVEEEIVSKKTESEYASYTMAELEELLADAVQKEEYEKASNIRDELKKRKQKK